MCISNAYAEKYDIKIGDKITLQEQFGTKRYSFIVDGIYNYPAALSVFMNRESFNLTFDNDIDYFSGYFSKKEITDIDDMYIVTEITVDDLTKTSRQLKLSMGSMMRIFLVFGIVMFMLIVYLLSKLIIEKNTQSISMIKILGYRNSEINRIYIMATSIVVVLSILLTIPIANIAMKQAFEYYLKSYPGWLPYYAAPSLFAKMAILGIISYAVIAFFQTREIKNVPLADALKNME